MTAEEITVNLRSSSQEWNLYPFRHPNSGYVLIIIIKILLDLTTVEEREREQYKRTGEKGK